MRKTSSTVRIAAGAVALLAVAAGCGSSSHSSSGGSGGSGSGGSGPGSGGSGGAKGTYTVGIITDESGPAASGNKTCPQGVAAGAVEAAKSGYTIKYVVGDSQTSPSAVLSAAKLMVQQDHVLTVIACSALTFGATGYLHSINMPVVGEAEDGPEWMTSNNMFSVTGALNSNAVSTATGQFFKMEGATTVGTLGYGISPSSSAAAKAAAISAQNAGLAVGYVNSNFPFGSTNVEPIALAMKAANVDGVTSETDPNTSFSLIAALREAGDPPKVAVLPDGYGGDLVQAGPGALQTGQGVYFTVSFEPVEMKTQATQTFQADLSKVGVTGDPTFAEYNGYASVALLVQALNSMSSKATPATLMTALTGVHGYNAWGLLGDHSFTPSDRSSSPIGVDGCGYYTKLSGNGFELVPGADPLCGTVIPGKTA